MQPMGEEHRLPVLILSMVFTLCIPFRRKGFSDFHDLSIK